MTNMPYFPFPSLMLSQSEHLSCPHREHFDEPVTAVPHLQQHHMMLVAGWGVGVLFFLSVS